MSPMAQPLDVAAAAAAVAVSRVQQIHDAGGRIDLARLVFQLGGNLAVGSAALLVVSRDEFTISVPLRSRYEVAHMTGHYVLHFLEAGRTVPGGYLCPGTPDQEQAANAFADELLMPSGSFLRVLRASHHDVRAVAEHFGVTPMAVQARAARLDHPITISAVHS